MLIHKKNKQRIRKNPLYIFCASIRHIFLIFYLHYARIRFYLFKFKKKDRVYLYNSLPFYINLEDEGLSRDLILAKVREPNTTRIYSKILSTLNGRKKVIDIGSNVGYYVVIAASFDTEILAVEPVKDNYSVLLKNVHNLKNVRVIKAAIGEKNTKKKIYIYSQRNLSGFSYKGSPEKIEKVRVFSLSSLINKTKFSQPQIVRMDVEGYEYNIIMGNKEFFKSMKRGSVIFLELHTHLLKHKTIDLLSELKKLGFELLIAIKENPPYYLPQPLHNFSYILLKCYDKFAFSVLPYHTIEDLLNDVNISNGQMGGVELFFIKKI